MNFKIIIKIIFIIKISCTPFYKASEKKTGQKRGGGGNGESFRQFLAKKTR